MKNISIIKIFIIIVVFIFCSNREKTTNKEEIEEKTRKTTVLDENESNMHFSIKKGLFVGLIENDSVFIKSDTIEFNWQNNLIIYLGNKVLYKDMGKNFYLINLSDVKIIQLKNQKIAYILVTKIDMPSTDKWLVLKIYNNQVMETYTVIKQVLNDIDNDGFLEIGGRGFVESSCFDCDSSTYSAYNIFKLNKTFEFDSVLSRELTLKLYGTFLGFNYIDTILLLKEDVDSLLAQ
jgi:hypothetical protein